MKLFTLFFFILVAAEAQIRPADQQYMQGENYLLNNGFESGRTSWTESGTATDTLEQSIVRFGLQSLKIVSSAQTVNLSQVITKYAAQSSGQQGIASAWIKSTSAISELCAVADSVDTKCVTIEANNTWKEYVIPFIMGSTNNGIRVKSASDSATTYIDQAFVGVMPATMMPEISQAQIAGEAYFAGTTNCIWERSSLTIGAFGAVLDCPAPTIVSQNIGAWQTTDVNLPRITINNLPAGQYKAMFQIESIVSSTSGRPVYAINDGATTCYATSGVSSTNTHGAHTLTCTFSYSEAGNRSFEIYAGTNADIARIINSRTSPASGTKFILEYYPPKSKIYSGDTIYPHAQVVGTVKYLAAGTLNVSGTPMANNSMTVSTTGDVLNICSNWSLGTGAGCVTGNKAVGVSFLAVSRGTYEVCSTYIGYQDGGAINSDSFNVSARTFTIGTGAAIQTFETNPWHAATNYGGRWSTHEYCQRIEASTTGRINYAMIATGTARTYPAMFSGNALHTTVKYFPPKDNPIIGTFEGIEKCSDAYECSDAFSAKISATGVTSDENIDWINGSCVVSATSLYTCSFNSGIVSNSMNCTATVETVGATARTAQIESNSSSAIGIRIREGGTAVAQAFHLQCQKQGSDYKPKTAKAATTNEMMYVPNVTRPTRYSWFVAGTARANICAASPCTVYSGNPSLITVTRASTGNYTFTTSNGLFKADTFIDCSIYGSNVQVLRNSIHTGSLSNVSGAASENFIFRDGSSGVADSRFIITCIGDSP